MFWTIGVATGVGVVDVIVTDGIKRAVVCIWLDEVPESFVYIIIADIRLTNIFPRQPNLSNPYVLDWRPNDISAGVGSITIASIF